VLLPLLPLKIVAHFKIGQKRLENNHLALFSLAHFAVGDQKKCDVIYERALKLVYLRFLAFTIQMKKMMMNNFSFRFFFA